MDNIDISFMEALLVSLVLSFVILCMKRFLGWFIRSFR